MKILVTLERSRENVNGSVASPRTRDVHLIRKGGCALVRVPEPLHVPLEQELHILSVSACCGTCKNVLQPNLHRSNFPPVTLVMCGSPTEAGPYELGDTELPVSVLTPKGQQRMGPGIAWQTQRFSLLRTRDPTDPRIHHVNQNVVHPSDNLRPGRLRHLNVVVGRQHL